MGKYLDRALSSILEDRVTKGAPYTHVSQSGDATKVDVETLDEAKNWATTAQCGMGEP